jgi:nucleoside-diphosphate-sugar epimerase
MFPVLSRHLIRAGKHNVEVQMAPVPNGGRVAVTGAAGFIGGWVVRNLLDKGYRVRACVRDHDDDTRTGFLKAMPGYASGRLTVHSADLNKPGCFDEIFKGCHGVAHLSHINKYGDPDYVRMVCDHIISSVNNSGTVNRVVVTSSLAAVVSESNFDEMVKRPVIFEDRYPDSDNARVSGYSKRNSRPNIASQRPRNKMAVGTPSPVVPLTTLAPSSRPTRAMEGRGKVS